MLGVAMFKLKRWGMMAGIYCDHAGRLIIGRNLFAVIFEIRNQHGVVLPVEGKSQNGLGFGMFFND